MRIRRSDPLWMALAVGMVVKIGCASSGVSYIHPGVDFGHIRRCAVIPFQNLSSDDLADERLYSVFLTEVLAEGVLEIVSPRETEATMVALQLSSARLPTPEQIVLLGRQLSVDALFFGSVEEYGIVRSGQSTESEITAVFGMAETQTGAVIWRTQIHVSGSSFWKKLFGGGTTGLYSLSQKAVRKALGTLF